MNKSANLLLINIFLRIRHHKQINKRQALRNLRSEVGTEKSFETVLADAKAEWHQLLSRIQVGSFFQPLTRPVFFAINVEFLSRPTDMVTARSAMCYAAQFRRLLLFKVIALPTAAATFVQITDVGDGYSEKEEKDLLTTFYSTMYRASIFPRQVSRPGGGGRVLHRLVCHASHCSALPRRLLSLLLCFALGRFALACAVLRQIYLLSLVLLCFAKLCSAWLYLSTNSNAVLILYSAQYTVMM